MKIKILTIVLVSALSGCEMNNAAKTTSSVKPAAAQSTQFGSGAQASASQPQSQPARTSGNSSGEENISSAQRATNADPVMKARLNSCLTEARQLARMRNGAYRASVDELYRNLKATQSYANLASQLSSTTTDLMTPLYQYRVNESCNTISQLLLKELRKGSIITN